jgi:surfactin synthase thioesterase subunit
MRACCVNQIYVPILELYKTPTIRALAKYLVKDDTSNGKRPALHKLTSHGGTSPISLVCVPYGGGNPIVYQQLANELGPEISLYSLVLPGRDFSRKREPLAPFSVSARMCAEEMLAHVGGRRFLYGHCAGAVVALEAARLMMEAGEPVEALILGGALPKSVETFFGEFSNPLESYSDAEIHAGLIALGAFEELPDSEISFVIKSIRHDVQCVYDFFQQAYKEEWPKLPHPVHCLFGAQDPQTRDYEKRYLEWNYFSDRIYPGVINGGHYFLKHQAPELARVITQLVNFPVADTSFGAGHRVGVRPQIP